MIEKFKPSEPMLVEDIAQFRNSKDKKTIQFFAQIYKDSDRFKWDDDFFEYHEVLKSKLGEEVSDNCLLFHLFSGSSIRPEQLGMNIDTPNNDYALFAEFMAKQKKKAA